MIRHSVEGISWQRILYFARELRLWKNVQRLDRGDFSLGKFYFRSNEGSFPFLLLLFRKNLRTQGVGRNAGFTDGGK